MVSNHKLNVLSREEVFRFLQNRGIEIEDSGDAFATLENWQEGLGEEGSSANFSADSRYQLRYQSGSGRTEAIIRWNGFSVIGSNAGDDHIDKLQKEIGA